MILFIPLLGGGDKGAYAFSKSIFPKVNVIARIELELAYFNVAIQNFSHYAWMTPSSIDLVIDMGFRVQLLREVERTIETLIDGLEITDHHPLWELNEILMVVWVLWHINLCRLFNAKSIFVKIVLFQTIQFKISTQFKCKYSLIVKNIYFKLFSLVKQF